MAKSQLFGTKTVHIARNPSKQNGCVNNGIFQSSTLIFDTYEDFIFADRTYYGGQKMSPRQKTYGRNGTETVFDCQEAIAGLYNAYYSKMTSCGYSAILVALNAFAKSGCHILVSDGVYGPTRTLIANTLGKYGVEHTFFKPDATPQEIEKLIRPNTNVIYLESPSSSTFEIQDLSGIAKLAKSKNITTIIDNTFFTSYYCNPFEYGIDVVVEACTKYLSGHSDVMAGVVVFQKETADAVAKSTREIGANTTPMNAYYILRGMRTLKTRLEAHEKAVVSVIEAIKNHPAIAQILHPSQTTTGGYANFTKHCSGFTSLFGIVFKKIHSHEELSKFFNRLEYFGMGYSWGGYESLAIPLPQNIEESRTFTTPLHGKSGIRIYIGLENTEDLIYDLKSSLDLL